MAETPAASPEAKVEVPKRTCEKCRNSFPLENFNHSIASQECVCKRCLQVMGYKV